MTGLSLLWGKTTGLWSSSMRILCMQIVGLIPFKSSISHPIEFLYFLKTWMSFSSWTLFRLEFIIVGHLPSVSRKTYLRFTRSCFNCAPFLDSLLSYDDWGCHKYFHGCGRDPFQGGCASIMDNTSNSLFSTSLSLSKTDKLSTLSKGNYDAFKGLSFIITWSITSIVWLVTISSLYFMVLWTLIFNYSS